MEDVAGELPGVTWDPSRTRIELVAPPPPRRGWTRSSYAEVRDRMLPGDVIGFSGKGELSDVIKLFTRAPVSHVGIVLYATPIEGQPHRVELMESTSLDGHTGVFRTLLSDRVDRYKGELWWLPLSSDVRALLRLEKFIAFLLAQEGKAYDARQAVLSGLDALDRIGLTHAREDFSRLFCSEMVAGALEAGGVVSLNASEVTPIDLCMFRLYCSEYVQLSGEDRQIRGWNTLDPEGWGE